MAATLVIPPEIKRDINPHSDYLGPNSAYAKKNLKGLFLHPRNLNYLAGELYSLLTNRPYVEQQLIGESVRGAYDKVGMMIRGFREKRGALQHTIFLLAEAHPLPWPEDLGVSNPVIQLHETNLDFLVKTSQNIIRSPENLLPELAAINPDSGVDESAIEYDYTAESYADGTWHPEHLFTNCRCNKNNPYWLPLEVDISGDADARGLGKRYNNPLYHPGERDQFNIPGIGPGGLVERTKQRTTRSLNNSFGQFPIWQTSINNRPVDRDNTGGLREGGTSSRRTQRPYGYDMTKLKARSSY